MSFSLKYFTHFLKFYLQIKNISLFFAFPNSRLGQWMVRSSRG